MAEIELFHYRKGQGILHRLNTGVKLLFILILTFWIFRSSVPQLIFLTFLTVLLFLLEYIQSRIISLKSYLKNTGNFLIFLVFLTFIRSLTTSGESLPYVTFLSIRGLQAGLLYSWKLFLLLIIGQLLTSTTDPSHIHGAVYRILRRLPLIPAGTIATMISLTITFIPLIFDQYLEVRDAGRSRLGNRTKNPFRKISTIALPLLQTTLLRADEISQAMESRCYNDNPTMSEMKIRKPDIISLILLVIITLILFLSNMYC